MAQNTSSPTPIDLLHDGIRQFHQNVFKKDSEAYRKAATDPQKPHSLVITCADSRVDPAKITGSGTGDIFVTRNIGNLVPAYGEMLGGVSAVIEYAVAALQVKQVIICGHSDCGAMKGLMDRRSLSTLPTVDRWLQNAEAALSIVKAKFPDADEHQTRTELIKENVLLQLNHLRTHPSVAGRVAEGSLKLYGWVYDIGEGTVMEYDPATQNFRAVE